MPRTAGKNSAGSKGGPRGWVWRFVDYSARWGCDLTQFAGAGIEMPKFIRWPLNAWKGEEGEAIRCINRLRADKDFMLEQGWLVELLSHATNQVKEYQGYLVSSRKDPLTASEVGSVMRVDGRRALAFLTRLESVGLLEKIAWPDEGSDGPIPDDPSLRLLQDVEKASRKHRGPPPPRPTPRGQNVGPPLNKGRNSEAAAQQTVEVTAGGRDAAPPQGGQAAEAVKLTCPHCGHAGTVQRTPSGELPKHAKCTNCGRFAKIEPPTSTTSTSPDAGVGLDSPKSLPGDSSPRAGPPSILRLGDILAGQVHRYSHGANNFGEQVLRACGYSTADPAEHVNEVAHFAKLWEQCRQELSEIGFDKAIAKTLKIAAGMRSSRLKYRNPQSYLEKVFQNAIKDQKRAHRAQSG